MFAKSDLKPSSSPDEISAFLGKETVFEGKMSFRGVFRLDGKFEGEIFESGALVVGESAVVKGKVDVNTIVIHGVVEGDVNAKARTEIHPTGKMNGNLSTPVLVINEGGTLEGQCKMDRSPDRKESSKALPKEKDQPLSA
jgi:cytoskeletal protein CcmA (bactofilin family)